MMTEKEALEKRCCGPHGCGAWAYDPSSNTAPDDGHVRYCIASDCMAWRWAMTYTPKSDTGPNAGMVHRDNKGDCGLKRKP